MYFQLVCGSKRTKRSSPILWTFRPRGLFPFDSNKDLTTNIKKVVRRIRRCQLGRAFLRCQLYQLSAIGKGMHAPQGGLLIVRNRNGLSQNCFKRLRRDRVIEQNSHEKGGVSFIRAILPYAHCASSLLA